MRFDTTNISQSEADKNAELAQQKITQKRLAMDAERHSDWMKYQQEKAMKRKTPKVPFPNAVKKSTTLQFGPENEEEENKMRRSALIELRKEQEKQMLARIVREKKEREEELLFDQRALSQTQADFDKNLQNLQSLVPPELGITVPQYNIKSTFSS